MAVFFEPDFKGHRAVFLGFVLRYLGANDASGMLAVSNDALESHEFEMNDIRALAGAGGVVTLGRLPLGRGSVYRRWLLDQLGRVYASYPTEQVYVLEGDIAVGLSLRVAREHLSRTTFLVIRRPVFIGTTLRSTISSWRKAIWLWAASIRGASIVLLGASAAYGECLRTSRWRIAPDPVTFDGSSDLSVDYAKRLGLDPRRTWYGVFGNVVRRKNLDLIARALADTRNPGEVGLLVAGRITPSERDRCEPALARLRDRGGTIVFDDRLLPTMELDAAIGAVDVAAFAQTGDSPSNIYGKARAAGVPVVCSGSRILRRSIRESKSGVWTKLRRKSMARAYESAAQLPHHDPAVMCGPDDFVAALLGAPPR